ncbi:hypothetical protein PsYK624_071780 [Phanerochaete sordida]|uniref:AB hydrolase-1 domain-containing protein n=1 Tax=Phanerochaete sordida TaxID=48140 RepID=A0A9P3LD99_9APHY|nr:hypothetical protein PsYK624_071780 [Phanerochaete sordida]
MPTATIDDRGTEIYYIDSGPPPHMLIYTTIVITHGLIVNGAAYERTLPVAGRYGLRIIAMNNRDYRGSTPYTDEELADFVDLDIEVQAAAVRRWGRETACFLRFVCETLGVPPARDGAGGVALMAEGVGNTSVFAMLGDARTMGAELSAALAPYLRKVLLFDSSSPTYGIYPDTSLTFPIADEDLPIESTADAFVTWSSAFYVPWPSVASITTKALPTHAKPLLVTPSLRRLPMEDVERMTDFSVTTRSALVMTVAVEVMQRHARCAFMDANAVLPDVEMVAMWCDSAVWVAVWGAKVVDGFMKEQSELGKRKRSIELVKIENSNHFPHLEEPEKLVHLLAKYSRPNTSYKT